MALARTVQRRHPPLQRIDCRLDLLGIDEQERALRGEVVAAGPSLDQRASDRFFQGSDTTLHRRLIDAERQRGCAHAAAASKGQEVTQIVLVEHLTLAFLPLLFAELRLPRVPAR